MQAWKVTGLVLFTMSKENSDNIIKLSARVYNDPVTLRGATLHYFTLEIHLATTFAGLLLPVLYYAISTLNNFVNELNVSSTTGKFNKIIVKACESTSP